MTCEFQLEFPPILVLANCFKYFKIFNIKSTFLFKVGFLYCEYCGITLFDLVLKAMSFSG